jgi:polar amino acid transport system permease protein
MKLYLLGGFPESMIGGLALNLLVAVLAFGASFVLGHVLAFGRLSRIRIVRLAATSYVEIVRAIPLLMVVFWFYFSLPVLFGTGVPPLVAALVALSGYAAAYQAEIVRAGIQAVNRGEIEAAQSLGLSRFQRLREVILPQAYTKMLSCFASYFVSLFKDTSVLYVVGLVDLLQIGLIAAERAPSQMPSAYLTMGLLFFIVCFTASQAASYLERRSGMVGCDSCQPVRRTMWLLQGALRRIRNTPSTLSNPIRG